MRRARRRGSRNLALIVGGIAFAAACAAPPAQQSADTAAVGDLALFGRFGFTTAAPLGLVMPGLADRERLLALALVPAALDGVGGCLQ